MGTVLNSLVFKDKKIDRVIWYHTAFFGDLLLATAAFRCLWQKYPHINQYIVTSLLGGAIYKHIAKIENITVLTFTKSKFRSFNDMKPIKTYLVDKGCRKTNTVFLQLHKSVRSSLQARYLGYDIVNFYETQFGFFASQRYSRVALFHETQRCALPLQALGFSREELCDVKPCVNWLNESFSLPKKFADFFQTDAKIIALSPGSVWMTKRWPLESYEKLAKKILDQSNGKILFLGSQGEAELTSKLYNSILKENKGYKDRLLDLGGRTSIDELFAIYQNLDLLISNDSSPVHLASCFSVPNIAIFGPTSSDMGFTPTGEQSVVVELADLECRPCSAHGPNKCPLGHFRCMRDIDPERVYMEVEKRLIVSSSINKT